MIFTVFCLSGSSSAKIALKGFSLKLSGGLGTMSIGDLNDYFDSTTAFHNAIVEILPWEGFTVTRRGEFPKLNTGLDLSGAFIVHMTDNFGVGIEFGFMQRTAAGEVTLSQSLEINDSIDVYASTLNWKDKPKLNVYPFFLTVYCFQPVMEKLNIYISGGAGFYFGKQSWETSYSQKNYEQSELVNSWEETDRYNLSGTAFGFKGGFGVEYEVSDHIALFAEGNGRTGTIKSLEGDLNIVFDGENTSNKSGTFWYYKTRNEFLNLDVIDYRISNEKPNYPADHAVRKWKTKLEGLTGLIGIRISFGTKK